MDQLNLSPIERESLVWALLDGAASIEKRLDLAISQRLGISFREFRILKSISSLHDNKATRVALAEMVGLTPSAITRALRPLEKMGYVTTTRNPRDVRQNLAQLTDAAVGLVRDAQSIFDDVLRQLPLPPTSLEPVLAWQQNLLTNAYRPRLGDRNEEV